MSLITTSSLRGVRVYDSAREEKQVGKVRACVFHPSKRTVIGCMVKRPDVALMFHRDDLFLPLEAIRIEDRKIYADISHVRSPKTEAKALDVNWDECILWEGMALVSEGGEPCGHVGEVTFDLASGKVKKLRIDKGTSREVLLGTIDIPAESVLGFSAGVGERLVGVDDNDAGTGALVVSLEAAQKEGLGGLAEKAGAASVIAADKVSKAAKKIKETGGLIDSQPTIAQAARSAEEHIDKGAYKVGEQLGKTRGMFSAFKQAYRDGLNGQDDD